ncbi:MAG: hypothetical protein EOP04_14015 [Proteobacteria bacterium]|nr:MAG: hypothetical protein EOP04_14015 [Pseudomonadota bacterium]
MSIYIVRVELHDVPKDKSEAVYKDLHDRMEKEKFFRRVSDTTGSYDLPTGLYVSSKLDHLGTSALVDALASLTATGTGYKASTATIKASAFEDFHWTGLVKSKK